MGHYLSNPVTITIFNNYKNVLDVLATMYKKITQYMVYTIIHYFFTLTTIPTAVFQRFCYATGNRLLHTLMIYYSGIFHSVMYRYNNLPTLTYQSCIAIDRFHLQFGQQVLPHGQHPFQYCKAFSWNHYEHLLMNLLLTSWLSQKSIEMAGNIHV